MQNKLTKLAFNRFQVLHVRHGNFGKSDGNEVNHSTTFRKGGLEKYFAVCVDVSHAFVGFSI